MSDHQKQDQAEKLQQLFAEVNNQEQTDETKDASINDKEFIEVDVLQLPPRSEVHQTSKWKLHINFRSPWLRFTSVLVLLAVVLFCLYYFLGDYLLVLFK
ncbi:MAG TPA: hypothetical protein VK078_04970 [Pseudogracilibacillus sp.]|nr:hypothetical protein [Pseudogracilibacillus sp.]